MPRQFALLVCILFMSWLFYRDHGLRPMTSRTLWIPLLWLFIIGTRPVSFWFNVNVPHESIEDYLEGSPVDRYIFMVLFLAGSVSLLRRRVNWGFLARHNIWFIAFFAYCAVSVLWSHYPFVAFKRWIKDLGNVVMILLILTETDPVQAVKAVFARYTYLVIPLSVVFIKYFPDIGREYNRWTWLPSYIGAAINKNELGMTLVVCGLFLAWDLFGMQHPESAEESFDFATEEGTDPGTEESAKDGTKATLADLFGRIALFVMVAWLLVISNSSTAIVCMFLGIGSFFLLRIERVAGYFGTYSLVLASIVLSLYLYDPRGFIGVLGRDTTFTGRTDLWADLLHVRIDPYLGEGYKSFWLGPWVMDLWEKYPFRVNQAHNGYMEIYLNGGLVGVGLLAGMIVATGNKLKNGLLSGNPLGMFCIPLFFTSLINNMTEATFNALSIIWFVIILSALYCPPSPGSVPGIDEESAIRLPGI